MQSAALPSVPMHYVENIQTLALLCQKWLSYDFLAVDTEFARTRTFWPQLGLIQVFDGEAGYLIDPLALKQIDPWLNLMNQSKPCKVMHACREDLEIFYHLSGQLSKSVFDTQIVGAFTGFGLSISYQNLVLTLCDEQLNKTQTRSNWLQRPLTQAQKDYAILDVIFLLDIRKKLAKKAQLLGRWDWVLEEQQTLNNINLYVIPPQNYYLRIKQARFLNDTSLVVLAKLCEWREQEAKKRDLARNFIIQESILLQIAKYRPTHLKALYAMPELRAGVIKRYGDTLLAIVEQVNRLNTLPKLKRPDQREINSKQAKKAIKNKLERLAKQLDMPSSLLANKQALRQLLACALNKHTQLPVELSGSSWRSKIVWQPLFAEIQALVY